MKLSRILIFACVPILIVNLFAVIYNMNWLVNLTSLLVYLPFIGGFYKKLDFSNLNLALFFTVSVVGAGLSFIGDDYSYLPILFFTMVSYFFLIKEALRYTRREAANRFMLFFFFLLIAVNVYFLFEHLQEMEMHVVGVVEFGFYTVFYVNLFILGIVGLIYYLNSYSRKSVYFITLVMTLVLADVLRDMAAFYLRDTSVLLMESILRFGSVFLAFQFFATEEKKLRLINLV